MNNLLDAARRVVESSYERSDDGHLELRTPPDKAAVDDLEAALEAYEWTDEPPSEPGRYWRRVGGEYVDVIQIRETAGTLFVRGTLLEAWLDEKSHKVEFAGPIPEPTDPDQ